MVNLVESMSLEKPTNGWFVPNCDREGSSVYLAAGKEAKERRIAVTVPLFSNPDTRKNALQVVHRWLNEVQFRKTQGYFHPFLSESRFAFIALQLLTPDGCSCLNFDPEMADGV